MKDSQDLMHSNISLPQFAYQLRVQDAEKEMMGEFDMDANGKPIIEKDAQENYLDKNKLRVNKDL